ncbi:MAG: tetratricopeptide repeat protein [Anaerolineae bacterium]
MNPTTLLAVLAVVGSIATGVWYLYKILLGEKDLLSRWRERPVRPRPRILRQRPVNFVDRDAELKQISNALKSHRWLPFRKTEKGRRGMLLCGMAGVGKTDLAIEAAYRLLDDFPDGVVWQFVGQSSVDDILNVIAAAFEIAVGGLMLPQKKIVIQKALTHRRALLIFDNAEQSVPISEVLDVVSTGAVIVTSRSALRLAGVQRVDVAELPLEGAVELFAQTVGRDLDDTERRLAEEVCERVGRLPLAVVLASSQAEILRVDLSRLLQRIDQAMLNALRLEINGNRSVRAAFQSTYETLSAEDQRAFALLSVFSEQGFSLDAVQAVNTDPQAEDRLMRLIALSLVKPLGSARYVLHPLLKCFAQEKLEDPDAYHRMANYYVDLARLHQRDFDVLELERPNILIVLDWTHQAEQWHLLVGLTEALLGFNAYYGFLAQRGYWEEGVELIQRALVAAEKLDDAALEARFSADLGLFYYWQGKNDDARSCYQTALAKFETLGQTRRVIQILHRLGYIEDDEDNYSRARELYERSLAFSEELGKPDLISLSRHLVGVVAYHEGACDEARRCLEQTLREELARGDVAAIARTQRRLAAVARMQGHYAPRVEKDRYFDEARRLLGEVLKAETNQRSRARALRQLGMVAQEEENLNKAFAYFRQSLELFEKLGNRKGISSVKYNLSSVAFERGDYGQAEQLCQESLRMARELKCRYGEALTLRLLARLAFKKGDRTQARDLLLQAIYVLEAIQSPHIQEFRALLDQWG